MSRVCKPIWAQPTGVCGYGDGLGLSDPSPTRARKAGFTAVSRDHVIHVWLIWMFLSTVHYILAHAAPLSAHENDTTSTTTHTPPLFLRDVGPMTSWHHPHCYLITTHQLGRPHQLAPPLVEGCGLAMSSPPTPPRPGWHQTRTMRALHERRMQG